MCCILRLEEHHFREAEDCGRGNVAVPHVLQTKDAASWQEAQQCPSKVDFGNRIGCRCNKSGR